MASICRVCAGAIVRPAPPAVAKCYAPHIRMRSEHCTRVRIAAPYHTTSPLTPVSILAPTPSIGKSKLHLNQSRLKSPRLFARTRQFSTGLSERAASDHEETGTKHADTHDKHLSREDGLNTPRRINHLAHQPVMFGKVMKALALDRPGRRSGIYVDGTFGAGGHAAGILGMS